MTERLSKTVSVYDVIPGEPQRFALFDEERDKQIREIVLDEKTVELLGSPIQITVTIEPGDTLTPGEPHEQDAGGWQTTEEA